MKASVLIILGLLFTINSQYASAEEADLVEHAKMENYLNNLLFKNFRFPFAKLTQNKYPENKLYAITWRDDGIVNEIATVVLASENQIGQLNQTYEE